MPMRTVPSPADLRAEIEQRQAVAEARRLDGQLDDLGAGGAHRLRPRRQIGRHAVEVVHRQHHAPARGFGDEVGEVGLPLDVDVFGAARERLAEDRAGAPLPIP